jgi:hypothetical protein
MALTPLPSSIGRGSNPRPSDSEPSTLPTTALIGLITDINLVYQMCGSLIFYTDI